MFSRWRNPLRTWFWIMSRLRDLEKFSRRKCWQHLIREFHLYKWKTHTFPSSPTVPRKERTWLSTWAAQTFASFTSNLPMAKYWRKISNFITFRMKLVLAVEFHSSIILLNVSRTLWAIKIYQSTWKYRWDSHSPFQWHSTHLIRLNFSRGLNPSIVHQLSELTLFKCFNHHSRSMEWTTSRCFAY